MLLVNHGAEPVTIGRGERIAQLVIQPVARASLVEVRELGREPARHRRLRLDRRLSGCSRGSRPASSLRVQVGLEEHPPLDVEERDSHDLDDAVDPDPTVDAGSTRSAGAAGSRAGPGA